MPALLVRDRELISGLARRIARRRRVLVEGAGEVIGAVAAPLFTVASALRRARTFHPRGDCADAVVELDDDVPEAYRGLAERLVGKAFVRLSDALRKKRTWWPDVLGCAVRFGRDMPKEDGDQDLLLATIKRPWTMPFSPFTTDVHDYFANDYFAVSPFSVPGHPRVYFRLRPTAPPSIEITSAAPTTRGRRRRRLERAIANGAAVFVLELAERPRGRFVPIVQIRLVSVWQNEPADLRFDPFRSGRGIEPRGFVHALRRGAYGASQRVRR
jgi:hypothetical protein